MSDRENKTDEELASIKEQLMATNSWVEEVVEQLKVMNLIALGQVRVDLPHLRHHVLEPKGSDGVQPTRFICDVLGIPYVERSSE